MLQVNQLIGFGAGGGASLTMANSKFLEFRSSGASETVWTESGVDFGTPTADRIIIACAMFPQNAAPTISGIKIGGNAATLTKAASRTGAMYHLVVPTGATGAIEVTTSSSIGPKYLGVWVVYGGHATQPYTSATTNTNGGALDINTLNDSFICAMATDQFTVTCTTAGLTEDFDDNSETTSFASGASDYFASSATPQAITMTASGGGTNYHAISASFQPA